MNVFNLIPYRLSNYRTVHNMLHLACIKETVFVETSYHGAWVVASVTRSSVVLSSHVMYARDI